MNRSFKVILTLMATLALIATGCGGSDEVETKAAFVMVAPIGDAGWNFAHNEGRLAAEAETGVTTAFVDAVPEASEEFNTAVQQFIDDGFNVIFTTSFGYMDATEQFATDNPDVVFEHISGFKMNDTNFGNSFGRMYEPRYIAGMAAGAETTTDKIGYVAAFPIPEVIRGINAFTLGARAVNPAAEVEVVWTSTWFDPGIEGNAAQALIDAGADVLTMHQDSTATGEVATSAGATFIGYHSDMSSQVDAYLTAPVWDWSARYSEVINAAADQTYEPSSWWGGMADGVVDIAIPDSSPIAGEMKDIKAQMIDGTFDVFTGPINAQDGSEWLAAGSALDDGAMLGMDQFVEGVVGSAAG